MLPWNMLRSTAMPSVSCCRMISPITWLQPNPEPLLELLSRYSRTHGPFTLDDLWRRYQIPKAVAEDALCRTDSKGKTSRRWLPSGRRAS